ncbi:hypothetical protein KUCAC02_012548, partial [Chaenocephalus aceratus]
LQRRMESDIQKSEREELKCSACYVSISSSHHTGGCLTARSVAQPQSEAVELSPRGPHLRGLTAACIISPLPDPDRPRPEC